MLQGMICTLAGIKKVSRITRECCESIVKKRECCEKAKNAFMHAYSRTPGEDMVSYERKQGKFKFLPLFCCASDQPGVWPVICTAPGHVGRDLEPMWPATSAKMAKKGKK